MKELNLIERAFLMKKTAIFSDLDLDLIIAIADKVYQDLYKQGEQVFEKGQKAHRLYLIAKGEVDIFDNDQNHLARLKENDYFGEEALFNNRHRNYQVICCKETLFLTFSKALLLNIISECPQIAVALIEKSFKPK